VAGCCGGDSGEGLQIDRDAQHVLDAGGVGAFDDAVDTTLARFRVNQRQMAMGIDQ